MTQLTERLEELLYSSSHKTREAIDFRTSNIANGLKQAKSQITMAARPELRYEDSRCDLLTDPAIVPKGRAGGPDNLPLKGVFGMQTLFELWGLRCGPRS